MVCLNRKKRMVEAQRGDMVGTGWRGNQRPGVRARGPKRTLAFILRVRRDHSSILNG